MIDSKQELITIIHKHLPGCKIFLFGSRARNTHQSGADYDIALDNGAPITREVFLQITNDIDESNIPVLIDVIDIHAVENTFLSSITQDFIPWTQN
jgi:predicted nucleotidyltransferase